MKDKLNFVLVGADKFNKGFGSRAHIPAIKALEKYYNFYAICTTKESSSKKLKEIHNTEKSYGNIDELVELQASLLEGILPLLRPGGRLVYATCTIHPEENIRQVERFIDRHPELNLIEHHQIWPCAVKKGDGFFAAAMDLT